MSYFEELKDVVLPLPQWVASDLERMVKRGLDTWGNIQWLRSEMDNIQTHMYSEFVRLSAKKVTHHDIYLQLGCPALDYALRTAVLTDDGEILMPLADFWGRIDVFDESYDDHGYFINYYGTPTCILIDGVIHPIEQHQWQVALAEGQYERPTLPQYMKDVPPINMYTALGYEVTKMMLGHYTTTCMALYSPHPIEEFIWRMDKAVLDGSLIRKLK